MLEYGVNAQQILEKTTRKEASTLPIKGTILDSLYDPKEIFVEDVKFQQDKRERPVIITTCQVPKTYYTARPIPYVTTENYMRCFSQISYIFSHHILVHELIPVELSGDIFVEAVINWEAYYRSLLIKFHEQIDKGVPFVIQITLTNFREIRRSQNFTLFTFVIDKGVKDARSAISGKMTFVTER